MTLHSEQYHWTGQHTNGEMANGVIFAHHIADVKSLLRKQGIIVQRIKKKRAWCLRRYARSITSADITLLTRQLATLMKAGVPLSQSFEIIAAGVTTPRLSTLIHSIRLDIDNGILLTHALSKHPQCFNSLVCSLVNAGEQSGMLDTMLLHVAEYKENIARIKKKIHKSMAYPIVVAIMAIFITGGLFTYVIPQFDALFKQFGAELPWLTRVVIQVSEYMQHRGWIIILIPILMTLALLYCRDYKQRILLHLPMIGDLLQKTAIARFARTLSMTFAAGLPLTEALSCVAGATGIQLYARATYQIREAIIQGHTLLSAIKNTQLFPDMVLQLISIGEESGTLDSMLRKIAEFYDDDVNTRMETFSSLLEPVIMTLLGVLIGCVVIAMYLPILTLGTVL